METSQLITDLLTDIRLLRRKLQEGRPLMPQEQKVLQSELEVLLHDLAASGKRGGLPVF